MRRVASRRAVTQHVATRRVATQLVAKIFSLTLAIHGILNLIPSSATMSDGIASHWRTKEEEPQEEPRDGNKQMTRAAKDGFGTFV